MRRLSSGLASQRCHERNEICDLSRLGRASKRNSAEPKLEALLEQIQQTLAVQFQRIAAMSNQQPSV
jgi:hypothetical protein